MSTDEAWEAWGQRDPYYGVITNPKFRAGGITGAARAEFFASGHAHAHYVMAMIHRHIDPGFSPRSVLDFGCGVGRLLAPFAALANEVVGADVSPSMLAEARANCDAQGLAGVRLVVSDDALSRLGGQFDLVHSFIVFQHVPVGRGRAIFAALLKCLAPGGVGAVHFTYSKARYADTHGIAPPEETALPSAEGQAPAPLPAGAPAPDPEMQMNPYPMNEILFLVQRAGVLRFHADFTDHGGEMGVFFFFQAPGADAAA